MVKKHNISIIIMKAVFTASLVQLSWLCLQIVPSCGAEPALDAMLAISVAPEAVVWSAVTAAAAPAAYALAEMRAKYLKK